MKKQLRIYKIKSGELYHFLEEWDEKIKPLRINLGFLIPHAWVDKENNQFIWILQLENGNDWEKLEKEYFNSEERISMKPNPARNIISMENYFIEEII